MCFVRGKIEIKIGRIPRPFPEHVHALTIWPLILYEPQMWDDPCIQIHDRYNWTDHVRWLFLTWFVAYFVLRQFYEGGYRHPLEGKAHTRQRLYESST